MTDHSLRLRGGRALSFAQCGDLRGAPVLYCHGFPGSRREAALSAAAASRLGLRLIAPDRPGFGRSTPLPGRTLADWAKDAAGLADALALRRFAVLGVSGGAPFALACAALLPRRVTAVSLASPLPPLDTPGATAGMPPLGRLLLTLFRRCPPLGRALYTPLARHVRRSPEAAFALLTGGAPEPDRAVLARPEVREMLVDSYREAFHGGFSGGARELLLFSRPWNLPLEEVIAPVALWHGEEDVTVPPALGRRLARALPRAHVSFLPGEGHFSLPVTHAETILAFLRDRP